MTMATNRGPERAIAPPPVPYGPSPFPIRQRAIAMVPPSTSDLTAARRVQRSSLIKAGACAALAHGLVLGAPLYTVPMLDQLREAGDDGRILILATVALGLFTLHTLLDGARARASAPDLIGPGPAWRLDALWIPVHLLVLTLLHPTLGAMALAGIAALGTLIALGALAGPAPWDSGPQSFARWAEDPYGPSDAFTIGLRFCGVVYQALIVGVGVGLVLQDALSPGLFAGAALVATATMRTTVRMVAALRDGPLAGIA